MPNTLVLAQHAPEAQTDSYRRLMAELEAGTYWIQYLCLPGLADYLAHQEIRQGELPARSIHSLYRPPLGNHLHALTSFYRDLPLEATEDQCFLSLLMRQFCRR